MTKASSLWLGMIVLLLWAARPLSGLPGSRPAGAVRQAATAVAPTPAISLSPTADLSGAADSAETPGELLTAYIVFAVVGVVVAITAFLVWRTRPKRQG
jgi:hypothetical protein